MERPHACRGVQGATSKTRLEQIPPPSGCGPRRGYAPVGRSHPRQPRRGWGRSTGGRAMLSLTRAWRIGSPIASITRRTFRLQSSRRLGLRVRAMTVVWPNRWRRHTTAGRSVALHQLLGDLAERRWRRKTACPEQPDVYGNAQAVVPLHLEGAARSPSTQRRKPRPRPAAYRLTPAATLAPLEASYTTGGVRQASRSTSATPHAGAAEGEAPTEAQVDPAVPPAYPPVRRVVPVVVPASTRPTRTLATPSPSPSRRSTWPRTRRRDASPPPRRGHLRHRYVDV